MSSIRTWCVECPAIHDGPWGDCNVFADYLAGYDVPKEVRDRCSFIVKLRNTFPGIRLVGEQLTDAAWEAAAFRCVRDLRRGRFQ